MMECLNKPGVAETRCLSNKILLEIHKIKSGVEYINPLNAELNPICHLLALLGAHHFLHVSRIRVNLYSYITQMNA